MFTEFNQPIVSALIIPMIFIVLEVTFTLFTILGKIRKHIPKNNRNSGSKPSICKYVFSYSEIINNAEQIGHTDPVDIDGLCANIRLKKGRKPINVRELIPAIEQFNVGTQLAFAALAIQFNNIVIALETSRSEKGVIPTGVIILFFQIFLAALVIFIHIVIDPDKQERRTRFINHVLVANFAGFAALFAAFLYLSNIKIL